jgi:hypothetical protein
VRAEAKASYQKGALLMNSQFLLRIARMDEELQQAKRDIEALQQQVKQSTEERKSNDDSSVSNK